MRWELCPLRRVGDSTKDMFVKDGLREKKAIGAISRTGHVMGEDKNTICGRMPNSLRNQPKKNGHLLSTVLDDLQDARGQDNS